VRIPFLRLASSLAVSLGHDPKPYNKQLSELRYSGIKTEGAASLLEVIRDKYIHTATRTARAWWFGDSSLFQEWESVKLAALCISANRAAFYYTHALCSLSTAKIRCWKHGNVIPVILNVVSRHDTFDVKSILHFEPLSWWALELYNNGVLLIRVMVDILVLSPDLDSGRGVVGSTVPQWVPFRVPGSPWGPFWGFGSPFSLF